VGGGSAVEEVEVKEETAGEVRGAATACSEDGDEVTASSKPENEAAACSGGRIEDDRQRRHNGFWGDRRSR
jgi:hypothetical protein